VDIDPRDQVRKDRDLRHVQRLLRFAGSVAMLLTCTLSAPAFADGIWISEAEVMALPNSGPAWEEVEKKALMDWGQPSIEVQSSRHDVLTYAGALYAVRTGDAAMFAKVAAALDAATGTGLNATTIQISRNVPAYIFAADLIGYASPAFDAWLEELRSPPTADNFTIAEAHERRPNNVGAEAGAVRIAMALWLGNTAEVAAAANIFHGFIGNRSVYAGFSYGDLLWQDDPLLPVGINPLGAMRNGRVFDGIIPDDLRRCECSFDPAGPFPQENYTWEALQGLVVQAELLTRLGYPAYTWEDEAIKRAVAWEQEQAFFPARGDDTWIPYVVNAAYGSSFCTRPPGDVKTGKLVGFTDWTHPGPPAPPGVVDTDGDCIPDDGDDSGIVGDNLCTDYVVSGCDDNCRYDLNYDQKDSDADGLPDACNACNEIDETPQSPAGAFDTQPISLIWTATDGVAAVGSCSMEAQAGDSVTLNVIVNPLTSEVSFAGLSLVFDPNSLQFEELAVCPGASSTPAGGNLVDGICAESSPGSAQLLPIAAPVLNPELGYVFSLNAGTSGPALTEPLDLAAVRFTVLSTPAEVGVTYVNRLDSINDGQGLTSQPPAVKATLPEPQLVGGLAAGVLLLLSLRPRRRSGRATRRLLGGLLLALWVTAPVPSSAADLDADGVPDEADNCLLVPNAPPLDCDFDQDGIGNLCDGDLDQTGTVDAGDYALWEAAFLTTDSAADFNCDGVVGGPDHAIIYVLLESSGAPGPSGLACAGSVPCP
jgi:hypothetical protein